MNAKPEPNVPKPPPDGDARAETAPGVESATPAGKGQSRSRLIQLPVVLGNRYKLLELRGGGGMAKVYRATDATLERDVAVKLINPDLRNDPEFDARFAREARIASQLADPHIVVVHDFGIDADLGPYIVMEYLQGQTLRERLASTGPLPLKAGLQLCAQMMLALIHAHNKNIIHRDIKPDNVFILNQSGVRLHVRVLDFGIARILRGEDGSVVDKPLTQPGAVMGTPRYMAPEQLAGQPADARSDLYSAAMVMHEALTGKPPFVTGKSLKDLCPDASDALCDLMVQCLNPNPNARPATAVEVYLRLQELGKASGILLLPPGAIEKLVASRSDMAGQETIRYKRRGTGRAWLRWAAAAGIAIVALAIVLWLLLR